MTRFYLQRVNGVGNEFYLGLKQEWHLAFRVGPGGYRVQTWKTRQGAEAAAERWRAVYPGQQVQVVTDGKDE